jgi:hypothetical protein
MFIVVQNKIKRVVKEGSLSERKMMNQDQSTFSLYSVLDASQLQCQIMAKDIQRLSQMINEAIPTILSSFNTMYDCFEKQGELSEKLIFGKEDKSSVSLSALKEEYKKLAQDSATSLDQVMIALQFHDMITQLCQNIVKRLDVMQDIFKDSTLELPALYQGKTTHLVSHSNAHVQKNLSVLHEMTSTTPVAQESMDSGDIDLF